MSDVLLLAEFVGLLFGGFPVRGFGTEHLVDEREHGVGHGDNRTLLTCAGKKSLVASPEVGTNLHRSRPCTFNHDGAEPGIPLGGVACLFDIGALVVAWAESYPRGEVFRRRELLHVDPGFGNDHCSRVFADAWDGLQETGCLSVFRHRQNSSSNLLLQLIYARGKKLQLAEGLPDQESLFIGKSMLLQGCRNLGDLPLSASLRKMGHVGGRHLTFKKGLQDGSSGYAEDVCKNTPELDVGFFENLRYPVFDPRCFMSELLPSAGKAAQFADTSIRDKAGADHAMPQEMGKPAAVFPIGLVTLPNLYITGAGKDDRDALFKDVEDRLPVRSCALHDRVRTTLGQKPQAQTFQFLVECSETSNLNAGFCLRGSSHHADYDERFADINAGTSFNHRLNHMLPPYAREKPMLHVVGCSTGSKAPIGGALTSARTIFLDGVYPPIPIPIFSLWPTHFPLQSTLDTLFIICGGRSRPWTFLGGDAEVRNANNRSFATLSLATKSSYKDKKSGQYIAQTEWHRCVVFGKVAEFAATLTKGAHVQVEGELRSRQIAAKNSDFKRRIWEIRVDSILKLDRAERAGPENQDAGEEPAT